MAYQLPRPDSNTLVDITTLPLNENIDRLDQDIHFFVQSNEMQAETYECRAKLVNLIGEYVRSEGVAQRLRPLGVSVTGLSEFGSFAALCATRDSDLDLCVCARGRVAHPATVLQVFHDDLLYSPDVEGHFAGHRLTDFEFVSTAKVPIIKFKIDGVSVDLSVTLDMGPPRTSIAAQYIREHCQFDERFRILAIFLKLWMKSEVDAGDHLRDYPNSYSLILMLIHMLQWYGIMPNLEDDSAVARHEGDWTSGLSLVQLLKAFAFHYANESMISGCQINMITGEIECRPRTFGYVHPMQIVDSFDQRNPARTVRSSEKFIGSLRRLLEVIERPHGDLFSQVWWIPQQQTTAYSRQ